MLGPERAPDQKLLLTPEQYAHIDATLGEIAAAEEKTGHVPLPNGTLAVNMANTANSLYYRLNREDGRPDRVFEGQYIDGEHEGRSATIEVHERNLVARGLSRLLRSNLRYKAEVFHEGQFREKFTFDPKI